MAVKNRISKLEKRTLISDSVVFIDARDPADFQKQILTLIENGLDPEGKKFVYTEDPLTRLLKNIDGTSRGLPSDRWK